MPSLCHPRSPDVRRRAGVSTAVLVMLAGCGVGGDGPAAPTPVPPTPTVPTPPAPVPPTVALRVAADTARPGTLVSVLLPGGAAPERADGTIAGVAVGFARLDDSTLAALVPEVPQGVQAVRLALAGRTGEASLSVLAGVAIANPTAVITAELDAALAAYATVTPPAGISSADWARPRRDRQHRSRAPA